LSRRSLHCPRTWRFSFTGACVAPLRCGRGFLAGPARDRSGQHPPAGRNNINRQVLGFHLTYCQCPRPILQPWAVHAHRCACGSVPPAPAVFPAAFCPVRVVLKLLDYLAGTLDFKMCPLRGLLWGGHSIRAGGAQFLDRRGVDISCVRALVRRSSSASRSYLQSVRAWSMGNPAADAGLHFFAQATRLDMNLLQSRL